MSFPDHGEYTPLRPPCRVETTRLMLDSFGQSLSCKDYECLVVLVSRLRVLVEVESETDLAEDD